MKFHLLFLAALLPAFSQTIPTYSIKTVIGTGSQVIDPAKDMNVIPALEMNVPLPLFIILGPDGQLYFSVRDMIMRYDPSTGLVTRVAGQFKQTKDQSTFSGDGGLASQAVLYQPRGMAFDKQGRLVLADYLHCRIRRITNPSKSDATIETIAGTGECGDAGDNGPALSASLNRPYAVAFAPDGTLFLMAGFTRLRTVNTSGVMGPGWGQKGNICYIGLNPVCGLNDFGFSAKGNLLMADGFLNEVKEITPGWTFTLIAGEKTKGQTYSGDGGPALSAGFNGIHDAEADLLGNTLITDSYNQRIRLISKDGTIRTIAGTGKGGTAGGYSGDGGPALEADFKTPMTLAVDKQNRVYVADYSNNRIRLLTPCELGLSAEQTTYDSLSGTGTLAVVSNETGCRWTVSSDANWLTFKSSTSGMGAAKLEFQIAANPNNAARTATVQLGGKTLSLVQLAAGQVLPRISAVSHAASFAPGLAEGAWFTISGTNLASTARTWTNSDFVNNRLPTTLDGVSVKVGGRDAYVYYVSPTQLNALAPAGLSDGPVLVQVSTATGSGVPFQTVYKRFDPAFFVIGPAQDGRAMAAAIHSDGAYVGELNSIPGAAVRPAQAGESIVLFGTGFGGTNPAQQAGVPNDPAPLKQELNIYIGGQQAKVEWAGVVGPGLVQVNVAVPLLPKGKHSVVAAIGGVESAERAEIAVE